MRHLCILLTMLVGFCTGAYAAPLPAPTGPVILTVTGAIQNGNAEGRADFDRAMLESLGVAELATSTPWTEGVPVFRGVKAVKLLDALGVTKGTLKATAINDFSVDIDVADLRQYDALLAWEQDGHELRVRDRGPLWIVWPRDQVPELRDEADNAKWIWQLKALEVR